MRLYIGLKFYDPTGLDLLAVLHGVCEIASLETWFLQMSLSSKRFTSWRCRKELSLASGQTSAGMTCLCPASACSCLLCLSVFLVCPILPLLLLPLPSLFCTLLSFILTSHSALLCLCYHGYRLLQMRSGGRRTDGRCTGHDTLAIYHCSSLSVFVNLYLFSVFN